MDRPNVAQEERVFNLHSQGKPIADMDDYNFNSNPTSGNTAAFNSGNTNKIQEASIEPESGNASPGDDKGLGY